MIKKIFKCLVIGMTTVASGLLIGCSSDDPGDKRGCDPLVPDGQMRSWLDEQVRSDMEVFNTICQESSGEENPVFSPYSLRIALSMLANTTGEEGTKEILDFLGTPDRATLNRYMEDITENFPGLDPKVSLTAANSFWLQDGLTPKEVWRDRMSESFAAEAFQYSSADSGKDVADAINSWVMEKTQGMIPELINNFNPNDTRVALVNATCFKAPWREPFKENLTAEKSFTRPDGTISDVRMMKDPKRFTEYYEDNRMKSIALDFGNGKFKAVFVLPAEGTDIREFVSTLTPADMESWIGKSANLRNVDVELPVFESQSSQNMISILKACGLNSLFEPAIWTALSDTAEKMCVNLFRQATRLRIDEQGGEASSATAVAGGITESDPRIWEFHANRPFFYMFVERACGIPLFMGTFENP